MNGLLTIIMEASAYIYCVVGFKVGRHPVLKSILPRYLLVSDEFYYFDKPPESDLLYAEPFAKLLEIPFKTLLSKKIEYPTEDQLEDLRRALGDEPNCEGGLYAYFGTMGLLNT